MADGSAPPSFWDRVKQAPLWVKIVVPAVLAIIVISAIAGGDDKNDSGGGNETTTNSVVLDDAGTKTAPTVAAATGPTEDDLRNAIDDADPTNYGAVADGVNVKQIELFPRVVNVVAETPEGGLDGASVDDLDGSAAATFEAIYNDTDWQGGATVKFTGGLVDTKTGRDLPDAETGLYRLTAHEAAQIDWDNASSVDWSFYRLFAHPALKD